MALASKIVLLVLAAFFSLSAAGAKDKRFIYLYGGMAVALFTLLLVFIKIT